jgi:hypothetical protein
MLTAYFRLLVERPSRHPVKRVEKGGEKVEKHCLQTLSKHGPQVVRGGARSMVLPDIHATVYELRRRLFIIIYVYWEGKVLLYIYTLLLFIEKKGISKETARGGERMKKKQE